MYEFNNNNKCIGDDTKAAARQSPNCIKNKEIWRKTIFNMADGIITPYNVARSWHWFRQVTAACNVAGGSGMTCHEFRPNVHHIGILHLVLSSSQSTCTSLRNFIQIGPPSAEKNDVMSIFKMADLSHLGFYGSRNGFFEQPMHDFLWVVNRDYSSKLLSFF